MDNTPALDDTTHPERRELRRVLWMLVLVAALHAPSLLNPFFIDDYVYMDTARNLDRSNIVELLTTSTMGEEASSVWWTPSGALPFYRPLGELVFAADYAIWGLNPFGFHLTNLLLHLLCTFLTWRVARRLIRAPGPAFVAAALFAIHPVHSEAVLWISGRFDLLSTAIILASVLAYFRWHDGEDGSWRWGFVSMLCFVIGLGCKETALILPAVIVAGECLGWRGRAERSGDRSGSRRRLTLAVVALTIISALYLAGRFAMFDGLGTLPPPYGLDTSSPLVAVKVLAWNLTQYMLDFMLFIQVDAIYLSDFWERNTAILAVLIGLCALMIFICARLAWRSTGFRMGVAWTALFTAPCLMAMPGERNVYMASVGVAMAAAATLGALKARESTRPTMRRWIRRGTRGLTTLCVIIVINEHLVMFLVAATGEKVFRDVEALLPAPPQNARIFVVNQCPLNAVGFEQGLNLRYGRDDIKAVALSLAPAVENLAHDSVVQTGPDSVRIERRRGFFFQSFVERFHLFSRHSAADLAAAAGRVDLELTEPPRSIENLTAIDMRLPLPVDDPRLHLFVWNNTAVEGKMDFVGLPWLTRLEPLSFENQ